MVYYIVNIQMGQNFDRYEISVDKKGIEQLVHKILFNNPHLNSLILILSSMYNKQKRFWSQEGKLIHHHQFSVENCHSSSHADKFGRENGRRRCQSFSVKRQEERMNRIRKKKKIEEEERKEQLKDSKLETRNLEAVKKRIRSELRKMKYKDKLANIQFLVKQAKNLSKKYGYFYVTGANFVYLPHPQIKLSLWIHPNLLTENCIHPIKKETQDLSEKEFYRSLKMALKEMFPTISLPQASTYSQLLSYIQELQQSLTKRVIKSLSTNFISAMTTPKTPSKANSNKVLKISELIDFDEIIEERNEEEPQAGCKEEGYGMDPSLMLNSINRLEEKKIPTSRSILKNSCLFSDQSLLSLEETKTGSSREKVLSKLVIDVKQLLLS